MTRKITTLKVPGCDGKLFENVFCGYVKTGREDSQGIISDYTGSIDSDGNFLIFHKGKEGEKRSGYEARLSGKYSRHPDGRHLCVEYYTVMSRVTIACFIIIGLLFCGFLADFLYNYIANEATNGFYAAMFFGIGFFALMPEMIFHLSCRSLEKVLDKIIGEYAADIERREKQRGELYEQDGIILP